jgi:tetratricopeptide (TPR) repeat protein
MRRLVALVLFAAFAATAHSATREEELARLAALDEQAAKAQNAGDFKEAERLHRAVVEGLRRVPDIPPQEEARARNNLASALNLLGRPKQALLQLERAQALLAEHPSRDPGVYFALHCNFGGSYALQRKWAAAEQRYRQGIEGLAKAGINDRLYLFQADAGLAYVYWKTGRLAEAKPRYESALKVLRQIAPPGHPLIKQWEQEYRAVVRQLAVK